MTKKTNRFLVQAGGVSHEELKNAIVKCSTENKSLIESILADERVSEEGLADSLAAYARFPRVNLATANIGPEAVKMLPQETARKYICIPIRQEGRHLLLAMANPTDYRALQDIEFSVGKPLKVVVCTKTEVLDAIEKYYEPDDALRAFTDKLEDAKEFQIVAGEGDEADVNLSDSRSQAEMAPVIKVVNLIIQDGIAQRGTDIHIEPTLNDVQVRLRIDGVLRPLMQLPKWLANPICSRVKILARLDISERRMPQDGRLKVQRADKSYDLRVSTLPTHFGEKVVLRILSSGADLPTLDQLGIEEDSLRTLMRSVMQPQGLILVTGPTGSGKSTTLYACLSKRKSPDLNIVTVEDPIEYQMAGINQVQVNLKAGLTFAHSLRSILRQDPDVILVGEMRDAETTDIAFHAAMTGHLVLSTLHTNSATSTLSRLLDLGVDPILMTSSITLIIAQRLLRKLCDDCKEAYDPPEGLLEKMGADRTEGTYYKAAGCSKCGGTGFIGRKAIYEMLPMTNVLREMVIRKASDFEIESVMRQQGMRYLLDRGLDNVRSGQTALSELFRVLQFEEEEAHFRNRCPSCKAFIEAEFAICPNCLTSLKLLCQTCNQQLKRGWKVCPYCKAPVSEETVEPMRMLPEQAETAAGEVGVPSLPEQRNNPDRRAMPRKTSDRRILVPGVAGQAAVGKSGEEEAPSKKPKILIVDDDPSIRTILERSLEQLPFAIETELASNGAEGVERAGTMQPDLIILDIMMPGMDGFEVCEKLRSQVETAFIPIMMLTASPSEEGRIRGYMVGTDDYVSKPFNVAELNGRLTRLLRRTYGVS